MGVKQEDIIPESFIVTVASISENFEIDMELPSNLAIKNLRVKLLDLLKSIDGERFLSWQRCRLRHKNNFLSDTDTLNSAGVFDGSRLVAVKE